MSHLNWGWKIAIVYIIFAALTVGFVVFALNTPVDLVRSDYYEESLRQDALMAERVRARNVGAHVDYRDGSVDLELSPGQQMSGSVTFKFYKPDQPSLDREAYSSFDDSGAAHIDIRSFKSGKWSVVARWGDKNQQYESSHSFMKE
ncbi:MAG: FixH family protein [Candidatus Kapabacteria bacterium]|nr:FixH family protein [Candidatus Kapabacteria bacterium]